MSYLSLIYTVAMINLLGAMSPGPDFVVVVRNSLNHSARTGIYTGIGVGLGILVHISYCAVGIALLISRSEILFNLIKYLGAAYLAYMGISALLSKTAKVDLSEAAERNVMAPFQAIKTGLLTNLLNPKATLFILGLFSFVISPDTPASVILSLTLVMVLTAMGWFALVSLFFNYRHIKEFYFRYEIWVNRLFGVLLILLSLKVALLK
jgi:Putative threonine efflux protein